MTDHPARPDAPASSSSVASDASISPKLCADCGAPEIAARGRCQRCYDRHLAELKKSGEFVNLNDLPLLDRLLDKGVPGWGGCIIWTGLLHKSGYGRIGDSGRTRLAHRVAYELLVGPIPDGMTVDHTCHNRTKDCPGGPACLHRKCINPHHLEAVTSRENILRSPNTRASINATMTRCLRGHPFDEANTHYRPDSSRYCRACDRIRRAARRAAAVPCGHVSRAGNACTRPAGHDGQHKNTPPPEPSPAVRHAVSAAARPETRATLNAFLGR